MMLSGCCPLQEINGDDNYKLGCNDMSSSTEELSRLRKVFEAFDENHDGFLALEELCAWMTKLGRPMTKAGLLKILKSCDWNNDGRLDFNEFVALTQTLEQDDTLRTSGEMSTNDQIYLNNCDGEEDPKAEMREAFRVFDKDGNGLISPIELKATLCELGLLSSPTCLSRIHSMIKKVDKDGDGQVSYPEFEIMMSGK